jgi:hypothetical protein
MNGEGVIAPNLLVALAFGHPWIGFVLALVILAWAGLIVVYNYRRHYRPIAENLDERLRATAVVDEAADDGTAQQAFADHYAEIEASMLSGGRPAVELRHAWIEFAETFVDKDAPLLQATTRPEGYFLHLGDDTRVLAWWANIFVAVGLTFTFLGIIAALVNAVQAIGGGADMLAMQKALIQLLTVTAAKFWTSIGGVVASIMLRWVDRKWHSRIQRGLEQLSDRIERGTVFYPPQRFAAEQLRELRQQSVAMTEFSTQLAASIGDALERNMAPVVQGLGGLQEALGSHLAPLTDIRTSIDEFKSGSLNDFGSKLGDAIKENAGSEMRGLADALTRMTTDLASVNDRLEGASGQASEQIATAARDFSTASEAMTRAFGDLNGNIEAMATRLAAQGEEAEARTLARVAEDRASYDAMANGQREVMRVMGEEMRSASAASAAEMVRAVKDAVRESMSESQAAIRGALDGFAGATAGIQTAFDQMRGQVAELGQALTGSASDAAERNAEVLARAAAALEGAAAQAQAGMGATLDAAITRSAEASSAAISSAFAAFGQRFEAASAGLVTTLTTTAGRMEALAGAIERSTGAASDHAVKLADAGREAQAVSTMLGRAANDVAGAAAPIREAASTIKESVGQSQEMLRRAGETGDKQRAAMETIATGLERTGTAAAQAWDNYRTRFSEVDEALGKALEQMRGASVEHATALNTQVGRIDSALAAAVERLAGALDDIKDLANALEDVRGRYEQAAE